MLCQQLHYPQPNLDSRSTLAVVDQGFHHELCSRILPCEAGEDVWAVEVLSTKTVIQVYSNEYVSFLLGRFPTLKGASLSNVLFFYEGNDATGAPQYREIDRAEVSLPLSSFATADTKTVTFMLKPPKDTVAKMKTSVSEAYKETLEGLLLQIKRVGPQGAQNAIDLLSDKDAEEISQEVLELLDALPEAVKVFEPLPGGRAVLTSDQVRAIPTTDKHATLAYLQPFLWDAMFEGSKDAVIPWVMFSSKKNINWLCHKQESSRFNFKPDMVVTRRPFFASRDDGTNSSKLEVGVSYMQLLQFRTATLVGVVGREENLSDGPLGELHHLHAEFPGVCRGIVLNETEFWLYATCKGAPSSLIRGIRWDSPGSADVLRHFFQSMPEGRLITALEHFLLSNPSVRIGDGAFLGAGSYGAVFRCEEDGAPAALKVVLLRHAYDDCAMEPFDHEVHKLKMLHKKGAPVVLPKTVTTVLLPESGAVSYCAYTMTPVGVRPTLNAASCKKMFESLNKVHLLDEVHADARWDNCVAVADDILWIDFFIRHMAWQSYWKAKRAAQKAGRQDERAELFHLSMARSDLQMLANSIYNSKGLSFECTDEDVSIYDIVSGLDEVVNNVISLAALE